MDIRNTLIKAQKDEAKRRAARVARAAAVEAERPKPPEVLPNFDLRPLYKLIDSNLKQVAETGCALKDFEHYLFETTMTCLYGDGFWPWYILHNRGEQ